MRPLALTSLVAVTLVTLWVVVLGEECYFSQEPDLRQNGRLRWVLPGSKSDHCRCTSIWPGPLYTKPLQRSQEPFYTDTPIFTSDQEEIHHFFDCHDCEVLNNRGIRQSGVYTIYPSMYTDGLEVYCDMKPRPYGWIVFQKRFDGSVNFIRNWTEYRDGFGDLTGEFWLGNEKLRQLTSKHKWLLQIDLSFDDQVNWINTTRYRWPFRVEGDNYTLRVEGLVGNAPLPSSQTPRPFSTYDKDNDGEDHLNCAALTRGGWWFGDAE
ncbi:microfibril-associated glycoprotein 4-like [Acanthaster planci]|uniref:Microfibril-associated glycoprotein 4-like n=1 Tax=Acanthaster planci TaxID=133434 RepID=A0A8B7ZE79_ACAPL|nr:microfibril-associated glycoprotein 4-like [Acanthaster planci]